MIKRMFIGILALLMVFCVACETKTIPDNTSCEQILSTATAVQSYDNTKTYIKGKVDLDTYFMSLWVDGTFEECAEFDLIEDYAICYSNDNKTYEIAVLKAKTSDDVAQLKGLLERRKQNLSIGDKAEYDPDFKRLLSDSKIIAYGKYVLLLVTEDNAAVVTAIEEIK